MSSSSTPPRKCHPSAPSIPAQFPVKRYHHPDDNRIGVVLSNSGTVPWSTDWVHRVIENHKPGDELWWDIKTQHHGWEIMLLDQDIVSAVLKKDMAGAVRIARTKIDRLRFGERTHRGVDFGVSDEEKGANLEVFWIDKGDEFSVEHHPDGEEIIFRDEFFWLKA